MKLIADSGSTKVDWALIDNGRVAMRFQTPGINAALMPASEIAERMEHEAAVHFGECVTEITETHFYGAGCLSPKICGGVAAALQSILPDSQIEVATDLLGAARSLCGHHPGIACILGTGSNSCLFDGEKIEQNVSPLGFILGDEGSGAVLGKLLIGNVLKHQFPVELCEAFHAQYALDIPTIVENVYRKAAPSKFLASFVPFISQHISEEAVENMVIEAFCEFFVRNVACYAESETMPINFVGSIAVVFEELLRKAARICGYEIGIIAKSPMDGLIDYHTN